ncbi:MAG: ABC transporter substrate-binding protein, partial [Clostridia bacterium]|nr:ABC transporter substrate-binding protein [Clostridia bacterium]
MKKIITIILILSLVFCMAACGNRGTSDVTDNQGSGHYPITLTDQAGRTVVIEKEPERLISGYYISTSLLIALDLDKKMVGIETGADKRNLYKYASPDLVNLPDVGSAKSFDLEKCASLNPDLVILPLKLKDAAETLDKLGIPNLLINPESGELLLEMIDLIAEATDKEERADELKGFISSTKNMLNEKLKETEKKTVYLSSNSSMLSTAGSRMYQNSMIELAGGTNVAGQIEDTYWAEVDYEQILVWNPEYFILAADAKYKAEDVFSDKALSECSAVKNGYVEKIPS